MPRTCVEISDNFALIYLTRLDQETSSSKPPLIPPILQLFSHNFIILSVEADSFGCSRADSGAFGRSAAMRTNGITLAAQEHPTSVLALEL